MFDTICETVEAQFDEHLDALETLVNLPSHTYAKSDVEAAAAELDRIAHDLGMFTQRFEATDDRFADHRVYETNATTDGKCLALVGHIDTVFPRSENFLKFSKNDDRAFGPGVLDMKSGLTTVLYAIRALQVAAPDAYEKLPLRFICVSDEEVGSPTSRHLYQQLAQSIDRALVFEKGRDEDRIITSRKGGGSFRIDVEGKAVHSGNNHPDGVNAIHALSILIHKIEAFTDYDRGITVNVGLIEGGTAKNTVPQHASCVIDARFVTMDDAAAFEQRLNDVVAEPFGVARLESAICSVTGSITRPPMEATAGNVELAKRYGKHARSVGLGAGEAPRQGGFSDSNLLAAFGVPVVDGLGPFGDGAHTHNEWCDLASLKKRTQTLALFLHEYVSDLS